MVCSRRSDQGKDTVNERCQKSSYAKLLRSLIGISPAYQLHMNPVKFERTHRLPGAGRSWPYQLPICDVIMWCPKRDSNSHALRHWFLRPACLPVPPSGPLCVVCDGVESITHLSFGRGRSTQETCNSIDLVRSTGSSTKRSLRWRISLILTSVNPSC